MEVRKTGGYQPRIHSTFISKKKGQEEEEEQLTVFKIFAASPQVKEKKNHEINVRTRVRLTQIPSGEGGRRRRGGGGGGGGAHMLVGASKNVTFSCGNCSQGFFFSSYFVKELLDYTLQERMSEDFQFFWQLPDQHTARGTAQVVTFYRTYSAWHHSSSQASGHRVFLHQNLLPTAPIR